MAYNQKNPKPHQQTKIFRWKSTLDCVNLALGLQIQNCGSPITKVKTEIDSYLTLNCTIDSSNPLIGHWLVSSEYTITQVLFLLITFESFPKLTYCTSNSYLVVLLSLDCQVIKMFELVVPSFK